MKSKSVTNLAEAAADPTLDAAGNPIPLPLGALVPTTEGPLGPVLVGHIVEPGLRMNGAPIIDVEAIEAGLELEEGAVGGIVDLNLVRPIQPQQQQQQQQPSSDVYSGPPLDDPWRRKKPMWINNWNLQLPFSFF